MGDKPEEGQIEDYRLFNNVPLTWGRDHCHVLYRTSYKEPFGIVSIDVPLAYYTPF